MNPALYQAVVRAGRTLGAAVISALITTLPQAAGIFELDPMYTGAVVLFLTSFLNGIGKLFRGETMPASGDKETVGSKAKLPI